MIYYIRDEEGSLIGIRYNNSIYYYIKNLQEDIIGITDSDNNILCRYEYDSRGRIITIKDNNGNIIEDESHIGIINPFRYRSYYYDKETKLYYLNSRYYNPEWGRFLNIDSISAEIGNVMSHNMYKYANDNSINFVDEDGNKAKWWKKAVKIASGVIVTAVTGVVAATVGGPIGVIAGAAFVGEIVGGGIGAISGGTINAIKGDDILEGISDGYLNGNKCGGVIGASSSAFNIVSGRTSIVGSPHGTKLHRLASNIEAGSMSTTGNYSSIALNRSLNKTGLNGTKRPDVIGLMRNGKSRLVEVISPKQSTEYIVNKVKNMITSNPNSSGKVIEWVKKISNIFRR